LESSLLVHAGGVGGNAAVHLAAVEPGFGLGLLLIVVNGIVNLGFGVVQFAALQGSNGGSDLGEGTSNQEVAGKDQQNFFHV
jgi:hypothetical protein